jgi:hypothetical protein
MILFIIYMSGANIYHKGKIHTIRNHVDDEVFVGSTCGPLTTMLNSHKSKSKRNNNNTSLYNHVVKLGGWDQFYIELHEHFACATKKQLSERQRQVQRELRPSLNMTTKRVAPVTLSCSYLNCECGQIVQKEKMDCHQKSNEHKKIMTANITEQIRLLNERIVEIQTDIK